jgi:hypothetical protein
MRSIDSESCKIPLFLSIKIKVKENNRTAERASKAEVNFMKNRAEVNKTASKKQGSQVLSFREKQRRNRIRKPVK